MIRPTDHCLAIAAASVLCGLAVVSSIAPAVEHVTGAVLVVAAAGWLAIAVVRRELRIRARLADPGTRPAPARRAPGLRAGPGDRAPVTPAPNPTATTRPGGVA